MATPLPAGLNAGTYALDSSHSQAAFTVRHAGISKVRGTLAITAGTITVGDDLESTSVTAELDAASVSTGDANRDNHLRSADFFGAKEFPEIVFESTSVKGKGDAWDVTGDLSFRGVTKSVTAKARKVGAGEMRGRHVAGFVAELAIDMNDFGVPFAKQNPKALGPEVHVTIRIECARE